MARKIYTHADKERLLKALEVEQAKGISLVRAANTLSVNPHTLIRWKRNHSYATNPPEVVNDSGRKANQQLEDENRKLHRLVSKLNLELMDYRDKQR